MLNLSSLRQTRRDQWQVLPSTVYGYSFWWRFFFASSGRGHSSRRTWDLSSLLHSSSATGHSTGNPRWLLVCCIFWLLSKSFLKLKVIYINAAYRVCLEILFPEPWELLSVLGIMQNRSTGIGSNLECQALCTACWKPFNLEHMVEEGDVSGNEVESDRSSIVVLILGDLSTLIPVVRSSGVQYKLLQNS